MLLLAQIDTCSIDMLSLIHTCIPQQDNDTIQSSYRYLTNLSSMYIFVQDSRTNLQPEDEKELHAHPKTLNMADVSPETIRKCGG